MFVAIFAALGGLQYHFDSAAEQVAERDVTFLYQRGVVGGHDHGNFDEARQASAIAAGESDGAHADAPSRADTGQNIRRSPAGTDGDCDIGGSSQGEQLPGEDLFEAVIIADGGKRGCIGGERQRGQWFASVLKAANKFRGDMLRVSGAAAITEQKQFPASAQAGGNRFRCAQQIFHAGFEQTQAKVRSGAQG
jgi:hypothetical protein